MSGDRAMSTGPAPGQAYGAGQEQMQLAQALPTPNLRDAPVAASPSAPPAASAPPADSFGGALAAARALRDQTGLLRQPSTRPNEPITAGLPIGPGPGPEVLAANGTTPAGELFRRLTAETGDPLFAELAARVRA